MVSACAPSREPGERPIGSRESGRSSEEVERRRPGGRVAHLETLDAISTRAPVNWRYLAVRRSALSLLGVVVFGAGCVRAQEPQPEPRGFRPPKSALVMGSVSTPEGSPVAGAQITAWVLLRSHDSKECLAGWRMAGPEQTWTNLEGAFEIEFNIGRSPAVPGCLQLDVGPPDGSGLEPQILEDIPLMIAEEGQPGREVVLEIVLENK